MKKILVPCDFSAPAQEAFKFAVSLATQSQGEIHVLYILDITFFRGNPSLSHTYAFNVSFLRSMETETQQKFQVMWERYSPMTLQVKFKHRVGSLIPDMEKYIAENEIDLVVMGTSGEHGAKLGSNTQRIVRTSPVPVMALRKSPERPIRKIVVPVQPGQMSHRFCHQLQDLQKFFGAALFLLWVNTPQLLKNDANVRAELSKFAGDENFTNYSVNVRADYTVEEGIYRFAKAIDADMLAMGTHGWTGIERLFAGSIAEDIVNHVNLPVWTFQVS